MDNNDKIKNISSMTRIKGIHIRYTHGETQKVFIEKDIPTEALIEKLKTDKIWQYRARIAKLLKGRKEKQVPEALLNTLKDDEKLEVRKLAMKSFETITGFTSRDIFNYNLANEWWEANKNNIEKNLKELQTIKEVINKNTQN